MKPWHAILISLLVVFTIHAKADEVSYKCKVQHIYDLTEKGTLEPSALEKEMKGSSFSVSRATGEIIGKVIPTNMAKIIRVANKGSKDNSFKAIAEFDGQVQVLEVQEFRSGPSKPFIASSMGGAGIITGICE